MSKNISTSFGDAVTAAQRGFHIRRVGWNDESYAVWDWTENRLAVSVGGNPPDCAITESDRKTGDWQIIGGE